MAKQRNDKSLPKHTPVPPVVKVSPDPRTAPPLFATSEPGYKKSLRQFKHRQDPSTSLPTDSVVSDSQSAVDRAGLMKGE